MTQGLGDGDGVGESECQRLLSKSIVVAPDTTHIYLTCPVAICLETSPLSGIRSDLSY